MSQTAKIESLQMLRGVAASLVVFSHLSLINYYTCNSFAKIFKFGLSGVDLFFVLSGFIIFYTSIKNPQLNSKQFFKNRFIRIYPIYWLAMLPGLLSVLLIKFAPSFAHGHTSIANMVSQSGINYILASIVLLPFTDPALVAVSWTLSFEILFYILFGLSFFRSKKLFLILLSAWVISCHLVRHFLNIESYYIPGFSMLPFFNPVVTEFFYGCLIACIITQYNIRHANIICLLGVALFCLSGVLVGENEQYREIFYGLPAALIVLGLAKNKLNFSKIFTYLGDASYSIYIFHVPILSFIGKREFLFWPENGVLNSIPTLLLFVFILALCCLIHSYIERPLIQTIKYPSKSVALAKIALLNLRGKTIKSTS